MKAFVISCFFFFSPINVPSTFDVDMCCYPIFFSYSGYCLSFLPLTLRCAVSYHLTQQMNVKMLLYTDVHGAMTFYLSHLLFDNLHDFSSSDYLFKGY